MKFLKYTFFVILTLIVLFFLIGLLCPTINYGTEITVNKPLNESWAVSQDTSKYDQWLEGFQSIELIEGEEFAIGSKYKVVVNPGNGEDNFEMIETILDVKENEFIEMDFDSEMMEFYQKISMTEIEDGTKIKTESSVSPKGVVMKSMFCLMEMLGGSFTKQESKNYQALKKVIEENTTDYFPAPVEEVQEEGEEAIENESADEAQ